MRAQKVSITSKVKDVAGRWHWTSVTITSNRIKPVLGARYYLRVGGRSEPVGSDPDLAYVAWKNRQILLQAEAAGITLPAQRRDRTTIDGAIAAYLEEVQTNKSPRTHTAYKQSLKLFRDSIQVKTYLDEILRRDILVGYPLMLKKEGAGKRTVYNRFENVMSWLKAVGVRFSPPIKKSDWPKYSEREVEAYSTEELKKIFNACAGIRCRLILQTFLVTGFRDGEVAHLYYSDFATNKVHVTAKPEWGWHPKTHEERSVPVDPAFVKAIQARHKLHPTEKLVFPNSGGRPDGHLIRVVKRAAKAGGITGRVDSHKFRATAATRWSGGKQRFGVQAIQKMLGHKNIATTMRYLAIEDFDSAETQQKVQAANADLGLDFSP